MHVTADASRTVVIEDFHRIGIKRAGHQESLKGKAGLLFDFQRFGNEALGELVRRMPIDINSPIWPGRTGIFASAATDAQSFPHFGNAQAMLIGDQVNRFGRAVFIAGPTGGVVGVDNTILADKPGDAQLHGLFDG